MFNGFRLKRLPSGRDWPKCLPTELRFELAEEKRLRQSEIRSMIAFDSKLHLLLCLKNLLGRSRDLGVRWAEPTKTMAKHDRQKDEIPKNQSNRIHTWSTRGM